MRISPVLLIITLSAVTNASEIYRCEDSKGRPIFSQKPCGEKAEKINIQGPDNLGSVAPNPGEVDRLSRANLARETEREIERQRRAIRSLESSMDSELKKLREKKSRANNNLAGAAWEQSISAEMRAVTANYSVKIEAAQRRLSDLQASLLELR